MESVFFRKDPEDHTIDKLKSESVTHPDIKFALFSSVLLMICAGIPILGGGADTGYLNTGSTGWIPLIMVGFQGYVVIAAGLLAFILNVYRKHGWAAICGGVMLALWLRHFISRTLHTLFGFGDLSFGFGSSWFGTDSGRYVRLFGYWVFPIVAAMVVYSSLKLRKRSNCS